MLTKTVTTTETERQIVYALKEGSTLYTLEICFFRKHNRGNSYVAVRAASGKDDRMLSEERGFYSAGSARSSRTNEEIERDALFEFGQAVQAHKRYLADKALAPAVVATGS